MGKLAVWLVMALCGILGLEGVSRGQGEVFGNMTYLVEVGDGLKPVTLVDGEYRSPTLCVYYEGQAVRGDFNRDGLEDAAVVLYDSGCGSGYSLNLAFLMHDGDKLVHECSCPLGSKVEVTALTAHDDAVIVEMLVPDPREGRGRFPMRVRKVCEYASSH